jgi:hypothetical protein
MSPPSTGPAVAESASETNQILTYLPTRSDGALVSTRPRLASIARTTNRDHDRIVRRVSRSSVRGGGPRGPSVPGLGTCW